MKKEDIKVGDVLRIRQWEDMKCEFGVDKFDSINIDDDNESFVVEMRYLCGKKFTVKEIDKTKNRIRFVSKEGIEIEARNDWSWSISAGMLERELDDNNNDYVASEDELLALMGGC